MNSAQGTGAGSSKKKEIVDVCVEILSVWKVSEREVGGEGISTYGRPGMNSRSAVRSVMLLV